VEGVYHILIVDSSADGVTVYDHQGRPLIVQSISLDSEALDLQVAYSVIQPLPVAFRLTRNQERLSGEWLFSQFQLSQPVQGAATGFRAFSDSQWEPWAAVEKHRREGVIDLLGLALENAPFKNFRAFETFWKRDIEIPLYFVVEPWLYGDGRQWEKQRREVLNGIFEVLRKPGLARDMLVKFPELARRAVVTARGGAEEQADRFLVSFAGSDRQASSRLWTRVPTAEEEADCACKLDLRESFLFFNPVAFSKGRKGATLLLKEMLRDSVWGRFAPGLAVEIFRQAWAVEEAMKASGTIEPPDQEMAALIGEAFAEDLLAGEATVPGRDLNDERRVAESLSFVLGRGFLQWLRVNRSESEILKLDGRALMEGWREYLSGMPGKASERGPTQVR
jgi:hypothetical protein